MLASRASAGDVAFENSGARGVPCGLARDLWPALACQDPPRPSYGECNELSWTNLDIKGSQPGALWPTNASHQHRLPAATSKDFDRFYLDINDPHVGHPKRRIGRELDHAIAPLSGPRENFTGPIGSTLHGIFVHKTEVIVDDAPSRQVGNKQPITQSNFALHLDPPPAGPRLCRTEVAQRTFGKPRVPTPRPGHGANPTGPQDFAVLPIGKRRDLAVHRVERLQFRGGTHVGSIAQGFASGIEQTANRRVILAPMHAFAFVLLLPACPEVPADSGPTDTGTSTDNPRPEGQNGSFNLEANGTPPSAPEIAILPNPPAAGAPFSVTIVTPSDDEDGDEVSYTYAWTVDGTPAEAASAEISGEGTEDFQIWAVTVTPNDGRFDGPSASASVTVGNAPPSAFTVRISPEHPIDGDDLEAIIDVPSVDPEGDLLTTTVAWYDDDAYLPDLADQMIADGRWVSDQEVFRVVVSVTDGYHDPVTAEASVTVEYTCDQLPPTNGGDTTLSDARGYHGLAFDLSGYLVGYDGRGSLIQAAVDGTRYTFAPGVGTAQQIERLPDGDLVYGDSSAGTLVRVYSTGATETMATDMNNVYGVTVGPDGMVYAVITRGIARVDPSTGVSEIILEPQRGYTIHSMAFNLDSTELYLGTIGSSSIWAVPLDADLNPTAEPYEFATGVGGGYHDGIGLDECGNLYVADYTTSGLYRVEPDGTVTSMVTPTSTAYGHGVTWGEDIGGWNPLALYQPQPYNSYTVREVVIGFASAETVRTWNGVAAPY